MSVQIPIPQPPPHTPPHPRRQQLNGRHPSTSRPASKSPPQPPRRKPNTPPKPPGRAEGPRNTPRHPYHRKNRHHRPTGPKLPPIQIPHPPHLNSLCPSPQLSTCQPCPSALFFPPFSLFFFPFLSVPLLISVGFSDGGTYFSRVFSLFFLSFFCPFFSVLFFVRFFVIVPPVRFSPHGNNNKQEQSNQHPSNRRYPTWQQQ